MGWVGLAALVVACGSSSPWPTASPPGTETPSQAVVPPGNVLPSPSIPPPCRPGGVAIGAVRWSVAAAPRGGQFTVWSTSPNACIVVGPVGVGLVDATGLQLQVTYLSFGVPASPFVVLEPGLPSPRPATPSTAGQATVQFFWANWCGRMASGTGSLVAVIPGIGQVSTPVDLQPPGCDNAAAPSVVSIGPLQAVGP